MCKKATFFIFLIFFCSYYTSAQISLKDPDLIRYQEGINTEIPHIYFLVQLDIATPQSVKNAVGLKALRKFSETIYIIDSIALNKIIVKDLYVDQLIAINNLWKLTPAAERVLAEKNKNKLLFRFQILFTQIEFAYLFLRQHPALNKKSISFLPGQNIIALSSTPDEIEKFFLNENEVVSIDVSEVKPKEELGTPGYDLAANKLNIVHNEYPTITGLGQHVSIKEDYYDTTDIDIKGRFESSPLAASNSSNHANFMATIIAGAGNSVYYALGAAPEAIISSSSFEPVLPDPDNYYVQKNITLQNHSYGTIMENNYGLSAVAFDKSANNNENLLHVFSSGNLGSSSSTSGNYSGIPGYANLTGNFKMAKNIMTVGAVDSFGVLATLSSKGPAYDGRIKPELVAFQQNGTSEAAALVSGTTLLLQQYYGIQHPSEKLPSALAKAILLNTADDIYNPGPDFKSGFGNMNAIKAMSLIRDNKLFSGNISQASTQIFPIIVPPNISFLKVTLVWNDLAATPLANRALVNDVDLEVAMPINNMRWKPWVLNSFPNIDSLNLLAVRKRDSLNNIEQVTIQNPLAGSYDIKITGYNLPTGNQKYHIAYSWDSLDYFKWTRPISTDLVEAGKQSVLRWENSFNGNGNIEYKISGSNNWQNVAINADLHQNYIYWAVPDTIAQAIVRMKIGNAYFYSDTFVISTLLKPMTGYVCGDSILIYWNKLKNIHQYQVYQLGAKFMEPLLRVTDTSALISKNILTDNFLAVAPILDNGIIATKSYAFNYNTQGAGCYINSFYAERAGDVAMLNLILGTLINIAAIEFEKKTPSGYITIGNIVITNQLQYSLDFRPLVPGITFFRAKITLRNGQVIYSDDEAIFYAAPGKYVLLPVPIKRYSDITLITSLPDGEIFTLVDVLGRKVLQQVIQANQQRVKTSTFQAGAYFYFITKNGARLASGKLVIL